jgi:predicted phosphodiesterase
MRYAIISDIHANIEALQAVIEHAKPQVDQFVCLGDIVGYNASPNECLQLVREVCEVIIVGNHDQATAGTRTFVCSSSHRLDQDATRCGSHHVFSQPGPYRCLRHPQPRRSWVAPAHG